MKIFVAMMLLTVSPLAQAFVYEIGSKTATSSSYLQAQRFSEHFSKWGFNNVSGLRSLSKSGFPFDQLFVSYKWRQALLLKSRLKVPGDIQGTIIEDVQNQMRIFHFTERGTPYLLVGINVPATDFEAIVGKWKSKRSVASECSQCDLKSNSMSSATHQLQEGLLLDSIGKCTVNALGGLGGSYANTYDTLKKLATNPQQLWNEMRTSFQELKMFVNNFATEMDGVFTAFDRLSFEEKRDLACRLSGNLLGGVSQAVLTGATLAKVLSSLLLKMKNTAATLKMIATFEKKGVHLPPRNELLKEAVSCDI